MNSKYDPTNSTLEAYDYREWYKEKSDDSTVKDDKKEIADLSSMPPLEDDKEEIKDGNGMKILTGNKLLTRLPVLLAQTKAGNN